MLTTVLLLIAATGGDRVAAAPTTSARPIASGDWVTEADYPADAIRAGEQGLVVFRMTIDTRGGVRCAIVESSGSPSLDAATCAAIAQRGRFEPARDARGRRMVSTIDSRVRWVLPTPPVFIPPAPRRGL